MKKSSKNVFFRKISRIAWKSPHSPNTLTRMTINAEHLLLKMKQLNECRNDKDKVTFTHIFIKLLSLALEKYPEANVDLGFLSGTIKSKSDISITSMVNTAKSNNHGLAKHDLTVSTLRKLNQKTVSEIATEMNSKKLIMKNKKESIFKNVYGLTKKLPGFILKPLIEGYLFINYTLGINIPFLPYKPFGSIIFSNVGSLGMTEAYPPLVPLSRCPFIICLGALKHDAWVNQTTLDLSVKPVLILTGVLDHRYFDGALSAKILNYVEKICHKPDLIEQHVG